MSYVRDVYVGWYAEFDPSPVRLPDGEKTVRFCPMNKKHSTNGKFCPECGVEIETATEQKFRSMMQPHHLILETDPTEIEWGTGGRATLEDIERLNGSHVAFPEFLGTDKVIVLAPGYVKASDVGRTDGFVTEIDVSNLLCGKPTQEWIDLLVKVFAAQNITIKYGVVMDVV